MASPRLSAHPQVFQSIRDRFQISNSEIAHLAGLRRSDAVDGWERGESNPTLRQAENLVAKLGISILDLLRPALPPDRDQAITDYRSAASGKSVRWRLAVNDAGYLQREYVRLAGDLDGAVEAKLPRVTSPGGLLRLASEVRDLLGVSLPAQLRWRDANSARLAWRAALEAIGILVMHVRHVDVEEFRAFSLYDPVAPLIAVNSADGAAAHCFSYFHELGHLLLRHSGACDSLLAESGTSEVERACNDFAGQFLVPTEALRESDRRFPAGELPRVVADLAQQFSVSRQVIAIRLRQTGFASPGTVSALLEELGSVQYVRSGDLETGEMRIPYARQLKSIYGGRFIDGVLAGLDSGRLSLTEGMDLLQTNAKHLQALRSIV